MTQTDYFPLLSGWLSLDLVNTEVVRWGTRHDLLLSKNEMLRWIQTMEDNHFLLSQQISQDVHAELDEILQAAFKIRDLLRRGFETIIDTKEMNRELIRELEYMVKQAPFSYKLNEARLIPFPVGTPAQAFSSLIAFDALQLLTEERYRALRRCANPECVLLFLDLSGRRKWCSMKICGNRAKVARHNQERKGR